MMPGAGSRRIDPRCLGLLAALLTGFAAHAGAIYKYRDTDGRWVFGDRPPVEGQAYEVKILALRPGEPGVTVSRDTQGDTARLLAHNSCYCPAEVLLQVGTLENTMANPGIEVRQLISPRGTTELMQLRRIQPGREWSFDYQYGYVLGDPGAIHHPARPYHPPFAPAKRYRVSQAHPDHYTHDTAASRHAVDIAMPEHSGVYAARGGVVVAVSHTNFRSGADRSRFGDQANIVKILHEDGTFGLYAHLSWDSIRVRPGQRVSAGEYIADSGSTGFTTGPHLHFVVLRNQGLEQASIPVEFEAIGGGAMTPRTGDFLENP
jgi:hypothetical protein